MKRVHIGHHFFGAGNLGDDFMLAGFFAALGSRASRAAFTCCVPHPWEPLARRFPQVDWRPYDEDSRRRSIEACDLWLGLGGSPFQSAVSSWFSDHLERETRLCAAARKPMYFLGVGGQDPAAYRVPALRAAARQAEAIWTRDPGTAEALRALVPTSVRAGADLAHAFFEANPPPKTQPGRLCAVLNFDFAPWPGLPSALEALAAIPASERVWIAQEARNLPGAERALYSAVSETEKARWRLHAVDIPGSTAAAALANWPGGEWVLSSRYHATLVAAWAGSRVAVLATNTKLSSAAQECGYPEMPLSGDPAALPGLLTAASPPQRSILLSRAALARRSCAEFAQAAGL